MLPSTAALPRPRLPSLARRLGEAATGPHGLDRYLELLSPLWVRGECRARIEAVRPEATDCATLVLRPNRAWDGMAAGQHVPVSVEIDGVCHERRFSVASSAHRRDGRIELTVKIHPDGRVSRHLVTRARPGTILRLGPAAGDFTLPWPRPPRLLLISGGSGITPVMSMLRTLCDEGHDGRVDFLHYARTRRDAIFADEVAALARRHPNVHPRTILTREERDGGRFRAGHLPRDHADCETYVCGPAPLIEAVTHHWDRAGLSHRLHREFFRPPATRPAVDAAGRVCFERSGVTAAGDGRPLLEQAEAAGLTPAHGCRMGICRGCVCRKTAGRVRDLQTGRLSGDGEEDIRICVNAPAGDVTLQI